MRALQHSPSLQGCNVLALLEAMQSQFSKEPPVYAKPKDSPQPAPQPSAINQDYSAKPPPPVPQVQSPPPQSAQGYDRPPLPPKPSSSIPNLNGYQANSPASFVPTVCLHIDDGNFFCNFYLAASHCVTSTTKCALSSTSCATPSNQFLSPITSTTCAQPRVNWP